MAEGPAGGVGISAAALESMLRYIGEDTAALGLVKDCDTQAQQLIDEQAKDLGKTLLESVWPTLPDIYG